MKKLLFVVSVYRQGERIHPVIPLLSKYFEIDFYYSNSEIYYLIEFFKNKNIILRFIEFMDVGNSNNWDLNQVMTKDQILEKINTNYNFELMGRKSKSDVAERWVEKTSGQLIEIISSISEPFCSNCTRARLSSEGKLFTCLFGFQGFDLKKMEINFGYHRIFF